MISGLRDLADLLEDLGEEGASWLRDSQNREKVRQFVAGQLKKAEEAEELPETFKIGQREFKVVRVLEDGEVPSPADGSSKDLRKRAQRARALSEEGLSFVRRFYGSIPKTMPVGTTFIFPEIVATGPNVPMSCREPIAGFTKTKGGWVECVCDASKGPQEGDVFLVEVKG